MATSACGDSRDCFIPETVLPDRTKVLAAASNGQAGRELLAAVFDGDGDKAARLLRADPRLAATTDGVFGDVVTVAISRCDKALVERLLDAGALADGPPVGERPITLALRASEPWFAETLLKRGASANARDTGGARPLDDAILLGSLGATRLLLDHGADVNAANALNGRPLQKALDASRYAVAELLLERGADPWAADNAGGTLGWAASQPALAQTAEDGAAFRRLQARVKTLGWPTPAPSPPEIAALAAAGRWPPPGARGLRPH